MSQVKQGRNDLCNCGSGKKYKQCCLTKPKSHLASVKANATMLLAQAKTHFEAGHIQNAIQTCQHALRSEPQNDKAMTLLGILAFYAGNSEAAIQILRRSIEVNGQQLDAHSNLAEIYRSAGKLQLAFQYFESALRLNSSHINTLINYGNALQDVYAYEKAIEVYQKVLLIEPQHTATLSNLGNVYQQLYRHDLAIQTFSKLLAIQPDYEWALGGYLYSKIHSCLWDEIGRDIEAVTKAVAANKCAIKVFELRPISSSASLELKCAQLFASTLYPEKLVAFESKPDRALQKRLKIAYLSADFREHPVSQLLVEVLEKHDRTKFEVIGLSFGPEDQSALRSRVIEAFDTFIDVRDKSDEEVARSMNAIGVDIAVDLMGYTTHARPAIFSYQAVPVQVGYLGYAGTTGSNHINYIVADNFLIPDHLSKSYAEKVLRLPQALLPRDTSVTGDGPSPTREEAGLPSNGFVFCAFNNHYKITPQVFDVWMRLLDNIKDSVLWLSDANNVVKNNLKLEAAKRGIASERIVFAKRTTKLEDHLSRHKLADLFLDTTPYNAHTTASDALWTGLPVLTCAGESFASRVAGSLLSALNLPELVTTTLAEYEATAMMLASNPKTMTSLRNKLATHKTQYPIFDSTRYARALESVLSQAFNEQISQ
ncbi:MAG TPA: tetratricopeptide repeat protein [Methylophilaceae bacterium]|jgi:predicted O-linked N-acetylglucosamine transferase (SPINDLY family)